jgi:post-segregation antitoxin (ccd killing protein)
LHVIDDSWGYHLGATGWILKFGNPVRFSQNFLDVSRFLQKALANENRHKESKSSQKRNEKSSRLIHYASNYLDDEGNDVLAAEFVWSNGDKPSTCDSLKSVCKN